MRPGPREDGIVWDEDAIIYAIRLHYERTGRPPTSREWTKAGPDNPTVMQCRYRFGSFTAALNAAGFLPNRRPGRFAAKPVEVRPGDVLERGDGSSRCEVLAVHDGHVWVKGRGPKGKHATIRWDRLVPTRAGYRVVQRAPLRIAA